MLVLGARQERTSSSHTVHCDLCSACNCTLSSLQPSSRHGTGLHVRAVAAATTATAMAVPLLRSHGLRKASKKAIKISLIYVYVHVHTFSGRVLRALICMDIIPDSVRFALCMQAGACCVAARPGRGRRQKCTCSAIACTSRRSTSMLQTVRRCDMLNELMNDVLEALYILHAVS